jgi:hypothetical protein
VSSGLSFPKSPVSSPQACACNSPPGHQDPALAVLCRCSCRTVAPVKQPNPFVFPARFAQPFLIQSALGRSEPFALFGCSAHHPACLLRLCTHTDCEAIPSTPGSDLERLEYLRPTSANWDIRAVPIQSHGVGNVTPRRCATHPQGNRVCPSGLGRRGPLPLTSAGNANNGGKCPSAAVVAPCTRKPPPSLGFCPQVCAAFTDQTLINLAFSPPGRPDCAPESPGSRFSPNKETLCKRVIWSSTRSHPHPSWPNPTT